MKNIAIIFLLISNSAFAQPNLDNPQRLGQKNKNQAVWQGLQVEDTSLLKGVVKVVDLKGSGNRLVMADDSGHLVSGATDTLLWELGTGTNSLMSKNNFSGVADTTYSLLINSTSSTSSGFQSAIINSATTVVNGTRGIAIGSTNCNLNITQAGKANNFVLATSNSQIRRELTGSIGGFKDSLNCVHCVSIGTYRANLNGYHQIAIGNLAPLVTDSPSTWLNTGWLFLVGNGTIVDIDSPHLDTRSSAFAIRKNGQTLINYTDPETAADADSSKLLVNGNTHSITYSDAYENPTASNGGTHNVAAGIGTTILVNAGIATFIVGVPEGIYDGQKWLLSVTGAIVALTVNGQGGDTIGTTITTMPASSQHIFTFNLSTTTWY